MSGRWLPMFLVVGKETNPTTSELVDQPVSNFTPYWQNPRFTLEPTNRFYSLVGLSAIATMVPLLARSLLMGLMVTIVLGLLGAASICRIWSFEKLRAKLGNRVDLALAAPYTHDKRQAATWLLCIVVVGVIAAFLTARGLLARPAEMKVWEVRVGDAIPLAVPMVCLIFWYGFSKIWTRYSPGFRLPELEGAYRNVSETVKEKITVTTKSKSRVPASVWRNARNVAQEAHLYGQAVAFFSVDAAGAAWKKSLRALLWYYAPVTVPCLILFATPPLMLVLNAMIGEACSFSIHVAERHELALAALAWASWSTAFFIVLSEREYGNRAVLRTNDLVMTDADIFQFGAHENRWVLHTYISGQGQAVLQLLVLAIMPLLMGYMGLFPEPEEQRANQKTACFVSSSSATNSPKEGTNRVPSKDLVKPPRENRGEFKERNKHG